MNIRTIILLTLAAAFTIVAVFFLNWFWRILALPTILIALYDFIQTKKDKKRSEKLKEE